MTPRSLLCLSLFLVACEEATPPSITVDVSPVNLGIRSTGSEVPPYTFNLQLLNLGDEVLEIDSVTWRGDEHCAFAFEGPDTDVLGSDQSAFLEGSWKPTVDGDYQIALEIASNASDYPNLVIPVCGLGVPPGTTEADPIDCVVPPDTAPDCEEGSGGQR